MSLQIRRLIVLIVSVVVSAGLTALIIMARIPLGPITIGFGTTLEHFAYSNVALLFIALAGALGIWLDYFLDAKILRS